MEVRQTPAGGESDQFRFDVAVSREKIVKGKISGTLRITTSNPVIPELPIPVSGVVQ